MARFSSGQDLKCEYSLRATRGHQNQEFSSNIRGEARESRGSRVFGTPKSFVFAPRGRDFLLLRLFLIKGHSMAVWFSPSRGAGLRGDSWLYSYPFLGLFRIIFGVIKCSVQRDVFGLICRPFWADFTAGLWTNFGMSCGLFLVCFVARSGCFCSWLWLVFEARFMAPL